MPDATGALKQVGWGGHSQLNTDSAVEWAFNNGHRAVFLDVQVTADGVPIALNDPTLERETDGTGVVSELAWDEIRHLRKTDGRPLARLSELLALAASYPKAEVFMDVTAAEPGPVAQAIGEASLPQGRVTVLVFSLAAASRYSEALPGARLFYRRIASPSSISPGTLDALAEAGLDGIYLPTSGEPPSSDFVRSCHRRGLQLGTYFVTSLADAIAQSDVGVDYAVTPRAVYQIPESTLHRIEQVGWGGFAQRNTVAAVTEAFSQGAASVVLDVQLTRDGVAVAINDKTLDRETTGTGPVSSYSWQELKDFRRKSGEPLNRLSELFDTAHACGGKVFLDATDIPAPPIGAALGESSLDQGALTILLFGIWLAPSFQEALPGATLFYKTYSGIDKVTAPKLAAIGQAGFSGISLPTWAGLPVPAPEEVQAVHLAGLELQTFLSQTQQEVQTLSDRRVDSVVTVSKVFPVVPSELLPSPRPPVIQQIGWGGLAQLNTAGAVETFFEAGGDGVVLDVQTSKDEVAVAINDKTLDRETDGSGPVASFLWEELSGVSHRNGEPLEKLGHLLSIAALYDGDVFLDVTDASPSVVADSINESGLRPSNVTILLFGTRTLPSFLEVAPQCRYYYKTYKSYQNFSPAILAAIADAGFDGISLPTWSGIPTPAYSWVREAAALGLGVQTFLSSDRTEIQTLSDMDVTSVIVTGYPAEVEARVECRQIGWGARSQRNTVGAILEAFELGADGVEIDIQVTADDVAVGIHDATLDRETDGTGRVDAHTWEELGSVKKNSGDNIDRLEDLLSAIMSKGGIAILDVRGVRASTVEKAVASVGFPESRLGILAFSNAVLTDYRGRFSDAEIFRKDYRIPSSWDESYFDQIAQSGYDAVAFSVLDEWPDAAFVDRAKARGLRTFAFLVQTEQDARSLAELGIDYLVNVAEFYDGLE